MRSFAALFFSILSLPLFAAISGTVVTTDGVAIAGARVSIHALETPYARRMRLLSKKPDAVPLASAETDQKGSFSLALPKEPVVDLRVELRGYAPFVRRIERDETAIVIALLKRDMVKGSVTADGKPVANALVVLGVDYITRSDEQGQYEVPAIEPPYALAVIHPDHAIDEEHLQTHYRLKRELDRTLSAGVTLTGRVVAANGTSPVAGAEIWVDDWPLTVSGPDGGFTIAHAPVKWTDIIARKGMLTGRHTAGGAKNIVVRLEPSVVLSGRIRDGKTNASVTGAIVKSSQSHAVGVPGAVWPAAITDTTGTYSIAVPAGHVRLSVEHPSYRGGHESLTMAAGQQGIRHFPLTPLARVSGVVLDEAGQPVSAATVLARDPFLLGLSETPASGTVLVTSGSDGTFDLRVPAAYGFFLHVSKKGFPRVSGGKMKLDAGTHQKAVVLTLPASVMVTGRALDSAGKPLSGVSVVAGPATPPGGGITLDDLTTPAERDPVRSAADGTFTMRLKEGWYHFTFRRDGYLRQEVRTRHITATGENEIEARLGPAAEISGRVTRGGVALADIAVRPGASYDVATTNSDGSFVLDGLSPGRTELEVGKWGERWKRTVIAPSRGVTIDLPAGGTVRGRVVEKGTNTPIRSFRAAALTHGRETTDFSSEDGSFTLEHVSAGDRTIVVYALGYLNAHTDVAVANGATVTDVLLELAPGVRVTGKVTDANGAPLGGVSIRIGPPPMEGGIIGGILEEKPRPERQLKNMAMTVTDASGRYTLDGLVPREDNLYFSHPGYVDATRTIVLEGREKQLDVQLSPPQP